MEILDKGGSSTVSTGLRRNLSAPRHEEDPMKIYLQVVLEANVKTLWEVLAMEDVPMDAVLERAGYSEKWMALGEARGLVRGVKETLELLQNGKNPEEILQMYDVQESQAFNDHAAP
jgi:hypothetical protein